MAEKLEKEWYTGITLALPHSSGQSQLMQDCPWKNDPVVLKVRDRVTDWFAKDLFVSKMKGMKRAVTQVSVLDCDVNRTEDDPERLCAHCRIDGKTPSAKEMNDNLVAWYGYRFMVMNEAAFMGDRPLIIDCQTFSPDLAQSVDVCIGYNEDETRPSDEVLALVAETFISAGYKTTIGNLFGGPIAFKGYVGDSIKITVNKRCYLKSMSIAKNRGYLKLKLTLRNVYRRLLGRAALELSAIDPAYLLGIAREALPQTCEASPMSPWAEAIEHAPPDVLDYYAVAFAFDAVEDFLRDNELEDAIYEMKSELKGRTLGKMDKKAWEYLLMHAHSLEDLGITWQVLAEHPNHKTDRVCFMGSPNGRIACRPVRSRSVVSENK